MTPRKEILWRVKLVYLALLIFGMMIFFRVIYLKFFFDKDKITISEKITTKLDVIEPIRGDICSSDGRVLATSVPYYEVGIDLNCGGVTDKLFEEKKDSLALCLSQLFPQKSKQDFLNSLNTYRDNGSRYYRISNDVSFDQLKKLQTFPILRKGQFGGGFLFFEYYKREMPFGMLCSRTIGRINLEKGEGVVGLEKSFDKELYGVEGLTVKRRIAGGQWMPVKDGNEVAPSDGYDLITTIDINIQDVAETALERKLIYHDADHGSVVVMEVATGKIKAIANLTRTENGTFIEAYNYAVGELTDPGSTFKLATVMVALEDGVTNPLELVDTEDGTTRYYNHIMRDSHVGGYGVITLQRAFEVSSNVGISKIINKYYVNNQEHFVDRLYQMNLNQPTGIAIAGEGIPIIRYPDSDQWSGLSLTQMSIGYEVQLTPLQILTFYNAVANNGKMMRPMLAESLNYRGEIVKQFEPEIIKSSICSAQTVAMVQHMLLGVVENGTAMNLKNSNYKIAGKTGTALVNYSKNTEKEYQASFVGYFPAEDPAYSCIVVINKPDKTTGYYANAVAGPVFKEIADKIHATDPEFYQNYASANVDVLPNAKCANKKDLDLVFKWLRIPSNSNSVRDCMWVKPQNIDSQVKYVVRGFSDKSKIPDTRGMGLKDAMMLLESFGLNVQVKGRGRVIKQEPRGGEMVIPDANVIITLG
jgi:cell division protein FtsI (penicillin-binding protein 3)